MTRSAEEIYHQARQRPAGEARAAYLDGACGQDVALRAKVEALLQADGEASSSLRSAADEDAGFDLDATITQSADARQALRRAQPAESPDQMIGRYKLLEPIGQGGFGSVWMAEQEQPVRRRVALKIIKLGMDTKQVIARFEAERQALAMMDHANIARVYDAGATASGRPYFVMELVRGVPISEYCDVHTLTLRQRLDLFIPVCQAIQHAHQKGIIHRDIKPSNVLVTTQDDRPVPKVIDFGIAKATNLDLTDKTLFTAQRQMIGTPAYMSPEQASSSPDIDTRTDIYSLGVLLYELLTGTTPFDSVRLRSAGLAGIQRILLEQEPRKPSTRLSELARDWSRSGRDSRSAASGSGARTDSRSSAPETEDGVAVGASGSISFEDIARHRQMDPAALRKVLRGDLDWIVMKCLEKDRRRRYETANDLAVDIERHLRNQPVAAGAPGTAYRMRKFVQRNRAAVIAGALLMAALVLGVIGTTGGFIWALNEKSRASEQAVKATLAADTAERAAYQAQIISAAHAIEGQRIDAAGALLSATSPRLRGWEYRHLASRLDRALPSPFPADWLITGLTTSAGSACVAVRRSVGGGPVEWVVLDGDLRTQRLVVPDTVSFTLSPDGTRAVWAPVNAGDQRPAVLWGIDAKTALATLPTLHVPRGGHLVYVTWSPTGDRFAISHPDGLQVHDGRTGALLEHRDVAGFAHFTGDSHWMILCGGQRSSDFGGRELRLLDAQTLELRSDVFHLDSPTSQISCWQSRVACAVEDGTLRLLEIVDGALRERSRIPAGINNFNFPAWSRDGRLIAVGSGASGRIRAWDADSATPRGDFGGPQAGVLVQWFLPGSGDLWACDMSGHHRVWPMNCGSPGVLIAHRSYVYPAVVSKDGSLLLTGGWDGFTGRGGGLKRWDARTGALVAEYGRPGEIFKSAHLTPDGRHAVASIVTEAESNHRTEVVDLTTGAVVATFRSRANGPHPVCTIVHPDGKRVISTFARGDAYVWDLATGKVLWETDLRAQTDSRIFSAAAAVSSDGRLLGLADRQLGIRLVNADTYEDIRRWDAHQEGLWSLSFSPDGKRLLSASDDQTIGVWDVATGALLARLAGHGAPVLCAATSPDGTRIASGGRDGIVRLWDTTHFQSVALLGGHTDYIFCLAWSPDGQQLISTSGDSTVRIWDTRTLAEQLAAVQARSDTLPRLEARIAKARADAHDPSSAAEAIIASPELGARERELARQVAARIAFGGGPAYFRAPRARAPIVIDGRIDEAAWSAAPWSEPFVDIEGPSRTRPRFETRAKMLWDDQSFYIAAQLDEPHVCATLTERDAIVLRDNDFEVFIDPDGDSRNYYELEFNAYNTIFDLLLVRTYREGGPARHDWNLAGLRSAVHVDGTINDPADIDRGWTLELALPWSALAEYASQQSPPRAGDLWRVNFSRVEWRYEIVDGAYRKLEGTKEDNWVWSPQGVTDMHIPKEWGFVEFVGTPAQQGKPAVDRGDR